MEGIIYRALAASQHTQKAIAPTASHLIKVLMNEGLRLSVQRAWLQRTAEMRNCISGRLFALAYRLIAVNVRAQLVTADACGLLKEENAIQRNRFPLKHGTLADAKLASDLQPAIAVVHQDLF